MNWLLEDFFEPPLPRCGYCDEEDREMIFIHQGDYTCACCLASWEGLYYNHATKRFRKIKVASK